ncbi:lanthionine synthetase C family protein [Streptomyces sp. NPDC001262]|uniref:lanthionine synthetase C family protein n=1 Tax=unclassified Streptomyces TaxID=2593676 RepID=UPI003687C992
MAETRSTGGEDAGSKRWTAVLSGATARSAASAGEDVAERLRDTERVRACAEAAARQTTLPAAVRWRPHDVAQGDTGLALFCGHLNSCAPGRGWDHAAHGYLASAARGAEQAGWLPPSLFGGLGGLAFAAWFLSDDGTRYRRLRGELDRRLLPEAVRRGRAAAGAAPGCSVGVFDAISGLAGTGACLLGRRDEPAAAEALRAVLAGLVALCGEHDGLPHWHTPPAVMADPSMARQFPGGNLNCGLAHGIPGPLALMALALSAGVAVDGQREAVRSVADWLTAQRCDDAWGPNWPSAVALPDASGTAPDATPARSAWCYGAPGLARALWLAGRALGDGRLCSLAVEAMAAVFRRPREHRGIPSPSFCHGVAGLLQVTLRFAHDTADPLFVHAATELTEQLLEMYAPERPLGYCSIEPGGTRVDQPGLLDGAPGVALALLAAATDVPPAWDRLFLLS